MDCLFCKLVNKQLPAYTIYEDDFFIAILDLYPTAYGHTLIIPKTHADDLYSLNPDSAARLIPLAQEIAGKLKSALNCDGLNLVQNNGEAAGQTVGHFHLHLIPRFKGDNLPLIFRPKKAEAEELTALLDKLKVSIS